MKRCNDPIRWVILSIVLSSGLFFPAQSAMQVTNLQCDFRNNPLGVDNPAPLLHWQLSSSDRNVKQTAYEILVSDSKEAIESYRGTVWSSGKVKLSALRAVRYQGKPLKSTQRYYWRVRVYDQDRKPSAWSEVARWEMGLLADRDWKGLWIGDGSKDPVTPEAFFEDDPAPLFRKDISIDKPLERATLYMSGPGYFEAHVNGDRINDHYLEPGWTSLDKRVLYCTQEVTSLLKQGKNTLAVLLGNGFYNPLPMPIFTPLREYLVVGRPILKGQLHLYYTDGSTQIIPTDESWKTTPGPILRNNVYIGEKYDARQEVPLWNHPDGEVSGWKSAVVAHKVPPGKMRSQIHPPVRSTARLPAKRMSEVRPGEFVFDLGQNFAGVVKLKVRGRRGSVVRLRYGEEVYSDGSLNVMTTVAGQMKTVWGADWSRPGRPQTVWQQDEYIKKSDGEEEWQPRFTFHGFRYVELTGEVDRPLLTDIEGRRLASDLQKTGSFACADELINRLEKAIEWTFLSNVFSVQSDCPGREKLGYGGDIVGTADAFCYMFDMATFYHKTAYDYRDAARPSGAMTETAPYMGIADRGFGDGSGPVGWQLAFGYVHKKLFEFYGNEEIVRDNYETFKQQVEFLRSVAKENLLDRCIGDHESLDRRNDSLTATAHYYHHAKLLAEFARLLHKPADEKQYTALSEEIKRAFVDRFYQGNGTYSLSTQTGLSFAMYYELFPEQDRPKVLAQLKESFERENRHIRLGIFGIPAMFNAFRKSGEVEIPFAVVTQKEFPGWGHMLQRGATTLWETWNYSDNVYSHNHPMFGGVNEWFYRSLLGINALEPGFTRFEIKPQIPDKLPWAKGTYRSVVGNISVDWKKEEGCFHLSVSIPAGTEARVCVPNPSSLPVTESGASPYEVSSTAISQEQGYTLYELGSGDYHFSVGR